MQLPAPGERAPLAACCETIKHIVASSLLIVVAQTLLQVFVLFGTFLFLALLFFLMCPQSVLTVEMVKQVGSLQRRLFRPFFFGHVEA